MGRAAWRHLGAHRWQTVLALLGIALGVAVVVAVDVATDSAQRAFTVSTQTLFGRATHSIQGGPAGVPETFYRELRIAQGVRRIAPVVEGAASLSDMPGERFQVIGFDLLADRDVRNLADQRDEHSDASRLFTQPGAAFMLDETARRLHIASGDRVALNIGGRAASIVVAGLLTPREAATRHALSAVLLVDIATAQELLDRPGRLTRIDLVLTDDRPERIRALLPPGLRLVETAAKIDGLQQMTRAFRLNLAALGGLSLIVGLFLIYNTMMFSVIRRRTLIGMYRALGVTRGEVVVLIVGEAAAIAALGALAGVLLGIALASGLIHLVTRTINDLYFVAEVRGATPAAGLLVKGWLMGVGGAVLAALAPAREAATTPPRAVMLRSDAEMRRRRALPRIVVCGLALLGLAVLVIGSEQRGMFATYAAVLLGLVGTALLMPSAGAVLLSALRPLISRAAGLPGRIAARGIAMSLSRTGVAIAALAIAVAATIGMGVMTGSFRAAVDQWLAGYLRADIYITTAGDGAGVLSPAVVAAVRAASGSAAVSTGRYVHLDTGKDRIALMALDLPAQSLPAFRFKHGDPQQIWSAFRERDAVIVTEPFAYHRGLHVGDRVVLPTDHGDEAFEISGVFYHYGADRGLVMMSRATYDRHWHDPSINSLGVYAAPGMDAAALRTELQRRLPATPALKLQLNSELHALSLEIFDRTFAITGVLRLLAVLVAFFGVLSALMALQLERAREFAVLRAIGLTPGEVAGLTLLQTGLIGLLAGLLALPCGLLLAWVLVHVINVRSFGWTMPLTVTPDILLQALLLALTAALLAGLYPAWQVTRTPPARALRHD